MCMPHLLAVHSTSNVCLHTSSYNLVADLQTLLDWRRIDW